MSRFSGPQPEGAARDLRVARRAEAEERQRAERARDKARAQAAARQDAIRALTDQELAELLTAASHVAPGRLLDELARRGIIHPEGA